MNKSNLLNFKNPKRKGIILAGGNGSRLFPISNVISKQLLPIYNKPMIYYPISTLMSFGVRDILLICTPRDINLFKDLIKDGKQWGINIEYAVQKKPEGIAQALIIGSSFIKNESVALILGDNLFYGENLDTQLNIACKNKGATLFAYAVNDPKRYGVVSFDKYLNALKIIEKPENPESNYAISGLYFYDNDVIEIAKSLKPSKRGELEITDINNHYLNIKKLKVEILRQGAAWLDTGTFDSLIDAGLFIKTLENRQALKVGYPEEIAFNNGWITIKELQSIGEKYGNNDYGKYLINLVKNNQ